MRYLLCIASFFLLASPVKAATLTGPSFMNISTAGQPALRSTQIGNTLKVTGTDGINIGMNRTTKTMTVSSPKLGIITDAGDGTLCLKNNGTYGSCGTGGGGGSSENTPSASEKAALVGTAGSVGSGNKYVTDIDRAKQTYSLSYAANNPMLSDPVYHLRDPSNIIKIGSTYHIYASGFKDFNTNGLSMVDTAIIHFSAPSIDGPWTRGSVVLLPSCTVEMGAWNSAWSNAQPTSGNCPGSYNKWDAATVFNAAVEVKGSTIYLFHQASYTGNIKYNPGGMGLATASTSNPDGPFTKDPLSPLIKSGTQTTYTTAGDQTAWDWKVDGTDRPIQLPNGNRRVYYKGGDYHPTDPTNRKFRIGFAETTDAAFPYGWVKSGSNPVYGQQLNGFPDYEVEDPHVVILDGEYHMEVCYNEYENGDAETLLWAKSKDGVTGWTADNNIEGINYLDLTGTNVSNVMHGWNTSLLDNDLQYITASGNANSSDKFTINLFRYTRTGNKPATTGYASFDPTGGNIIAEDKGTRNALPVSSFVRTSGVNNIVQDDSDGVAKGFYLTAYVGSDGLSFSPAASFRQSRGTLVAPRRTKSGDILMAFGGRGSEAADDSTASVFNTTSSGIMRVYATEDHSSGHHGAEFRFLTIPNGGTTPSVGLKLTQDGKVFIPTGKSLYFESDGSSMTAAASPGGASSNVQSNCSGAFCGDDDFKHVTSGTRGVYLGGTNNTVFGVYAPAAYGGGRTIVFGVDTNAGYSYFGDTSVGSMPSSGTLRVIGSMNITGDYLKNGVPLSGTGTVTSVTCGTGLTGGTITSSGTCAVDEGQGAGQLVALDSNARFGVGTTSAVSAIHGKMAGVAVTGERTTTSINDSPGVAAQTIFNTSLTAGNGFGSCYAMSYSDTGGGISAQQLGQICSVRNGASNTGDVTIRPLVAGTATEKFRVSSTGVTTINGGTNTIYYCNGGTNAGLLGRGNAGPCSGGTWIATSLKLD